MVESLRGIEQARSDVLGLEIRVLDQDVLGALTRGEQLENVGHPDAETANAGTTAVV